MLYTYTDVSLDQWSEDEGGWHVILAAKREPDGVNADLEAHIPHDAISVEWYSDDEWSATLSLENVWWTEYIDGLETMPDFAPNAATIDAISDALRGSELVDELAERVRAFNEEEHAISGVWLDGGR